VKWTRRSLFGALVGLVVTPWRYLVKGQAPTAIPYSPEDILEDVRMMTLLSKNQPPVSMESLRITEATRKVLEAIDDAMINGRRGV